MIVRLAFKTPGVVDTAVSESWSPAQVEEIAEVRKACEKWVRYGEFLTVYVDTEKGTCTAVPVSGEREQMVTLAAALKAVEDEEEYPGDIPDSLKEKLASGIDAVVEALRVTVRLTKDRIKKRLGKAAG